MKFSIITPSFNQLPYLKRCIASVADQSGIDIEHIVIDGGSADGTVEFLQEYTARQPATDNYKLTFSSEVDEGMYDALNKGFARSSGDIFAWLNCDEQYLPGTLAFVRDWFIAYSKADLLSGGALLIRPDGSLLAFRKAFPLRRHYITISHLYNLSCGMFFRRRVWERGIHFDTSFRNLGDQDWVMRLLKDGIKAGCTDHFLSAFCFTGQNLSQSEQALSEEQRLRAQHLLIQRMRCPLNLVRWAEKVLRGAYHQKPFDYAVYSEEEPFSRERFHIQKASFRWPGVQRGVSK
jgi:glycosyltransferase involved in cell wall biosynthesis